jgi:ATP-dependent DNA helicase RecQ
MTMILAASRLLAIMPEVRILFLAYNKDIKEEVKKNAKEYLGEDRISVENYDSLLVNYYDSSTASQDFALSMRRVVQNDEDPLAENRGNLAWDLVIVDEAQDIDENYMGFLQKVLRDNRVPHKDSVQLISVGDPKQNIFQYRGAKSDFFQKEVFDNEGHLFCLHPAGTATLFLSKTFRFCQELCRFVDGLCSSLFQENYVQHMSGRLLEFTEESSVEH